MITLQQLKYFRELANNERLTRTAEKLYITQTTLSNTIKNLESQLGIKLFDRVGRTIQLNEAGKLYLAYVNDALQSLENAQAALEDHKRESSSPFRSPPSIPSSGSSRCKASAPAIPPTISGRTPLTRPSSAGCSSIKR